MDFKTYNMEYEEFLALMDQTTENLKRMSELQSKLRLQFGDASKYEMFTHEINEAINGWISSGC